MRLDFVTILGIVCVIVAILMLTAQVAGGVVGAIILGVLGLLLLVGAYPGSRRGL